MKIWKSKQSNKPKMLISVLVLITTWCCGGVLNNNVRCCETFEHETRTGTRIIGTVMNHRGIDVVLFRGIYFAEAPVGKQRFTAPVLRPFSGSSSDDNSNVIINATQPQPSCITTKMEQQPQSEDCLHLSIWIPKSILAAHQQLTALSPVIFYLYGGSFKMGSVNNDENDCLALSAEQNIIVVAPNYRMGIFGFLDLNIPAAPGNMGIRDQAVALQWVRENIRLFGGNPNQTTAFGFSAGSRSITAHIAHPETHKLFKRVILDGGVYLANSIVNSTSTKCTERARKLASELCPPPNSNDTLENIVKCLTNADVDTLRNYSDQFAWITYGNTYIPQDPLITLRNGLKLPQGFEILVGCGRDEARYWIADKAGNKPLFKDRDEAATYTMDRANTRGLQIVDSNALDNYLGLGEEFATDVSDFIGDAAFYCGIITYADLLAAKSSARVYVYKSHYRGNTTLYPEWSGVCHGLTIAYLLGTIRAAQQELASPQTQQFTTRFTQLVGDFAKRNDSTIVNNNSSTIFGKSNTDEGPLFQGKPLRQWIINSEKYYDDEETRTCNNNKKWQRETNIFTADGQLVFTPDHPRDAWCTRFWSR